MAKRTSGSAPKLLLSLASGFISAIMLIYGYNLGWFSVHMYYLYIFSVCYYFIICKGDKVATAYTIAGIITSTTFLLSIKFLDVVLGIMIGTISAYFVAFMTDILVQCDWNYFYLGDFNLSTFPIERSIQFRFDQHVPVTDAPPAAEMLEPEEDEDKAEKPKRKTEKTPLSRKAKKAEAKKQKRERKKS